MLEWVVEMAEDGIPRHFTRPYSTQAEAVAEAERLSALAKDAETQRD